MPYWVFHHLFTNSVSSFTCSQLWFVSSKNYLYSSRLLRRVLSIERHPTYWWWPHNQGTPLKADTDLGSIPPWSLVTLYTTLDKLPIRIYPGFLYVSSEFIPTPNNILIERVVRRIRSFILINSEITNVTTSRSASIPEIHWSVHI